MANARNSRTTHPKKKARRAVALGNFTVQRNRTNDKNYMYRKHQEYLALGGSTFTFEQISA